MSKAERKAQEKAVYKQRFVAAFQALDGWTSPARAAQVAAEQDDVFMTRRRLGSDILLVFTGRKREDVPYGVSYPPIKGGASHIVELLVADDILERQLDHSRDYDLSPFTHYPGEDGHVYRLASSQE